MSRSKGERILVRNWRKERISYVFPVTVVEDSEEYFALYLAAGSPIKHRVKPDGSPLGRELSFAERASLPVEVGDGRWTENSVLMLTKPGEAHAFWAFWRDSDWKFLGWYVNLQAPFARTTLGFDTADHVLDIVVEPDGNWEWKDLDEFEEARCVGRFTLEEAEGILAEAERAVSKIKSRAWPLGSEWEKWKPEPEWEVPSMPRNWNET